MGKNLCARNCLLDALQETEGPFHLTRSDGKCERTPPGTSELKLFRLAQKTQYAGNRLSRHSPLSFKSYCSA